jgi:hypothetical protein
MQNNNPTYPTSLISAQIETTVAAPLRKLLDDNALQFVEITGSENNWADDSYPYVVVRLTFFR